MRTDRLTDREQKVLEAVIHSYVESAEPAGSRTIAKRFNLGVSAATIRNVMSDLEDKGYLFHTHTSGGRIPTDQAYRLYVDGLMEKSDPTQMEQDTLRRQFGNGNSPVEEILRDAAQVLGVLTQELGVAVAPSLDGAVLERLELMHVSAEKVLMVLLLKGGVAKTIFVEVRSELPREALASLTMVLNERLGGLTLERIRKTLPERMRDVNVEPRGHELINIFVEEADQIFQVSSEGTSPVLLSSAQMLAEQPEFSSNDQMRNLLELTEQRELLRTAFEGRYGPGIRITIGWENVDPKLSSFTLVTAQYQSGSLAGVIGVMGPTRMPYQKVVALVGHTSRLMSEFAR
ncbi:MAG: heat-inducible transcriptional repressor HrcA [Gemmatimonadales bacterium]